MENVLGIKKLQNGIYFTAIQNEARRIGYRVLPVEINCWEFGVPQKRVRQLFIGTLVNLPIFAPTRYLRKTHSLHAQNENLLPIVTLGEAIEDLFEAGDKKVKLAMKLGDPDADPARYNAAVAAFWKVMNKQ